MVNGDGDIQLPRHPRRGEAILDAQLAPRAVAIGVHRSLRHAELAGDLLRRQMLVHQPQAIALALGEQSHRVFDDFVACPHSARIKRRLGLRVYFNAQLGLH
jgi:hypothetical protein